MQPYKIKSKLKITYVKKPKNFTIIRKLQNPFKTMLFNYITNLLIYKNIGQINNNFIKASLSQ